MWSEFFIHFPGTHPADELVESIKKAMGDKEMAANLERIHNLYLDREEKPVEKVEKLSRKQACKPRSYASPKLRLTDSLTGVKCRATSVAKNSIVLC